MSQVAVSPESQRPEVPPLRFVYTNHGGTISVRQVRPLELYYGTTEYYPQSQWLLRAFCLDRKAERTFAVASMSPLR